MKEQYGENIQKQYTEGRRYNDIICPLRFCRYNEFASLKDRKIQEYDKG